MTDAERAVGSARALGWLEGFAATVWLLPQLKDADGAELVCDEACAEYESRVAELRGLLMKEDPA
jgi:hypothetical protein